MIYKGTHKLHLAPLQGWINDPNGLVFYKGQYHAFYQHYPHSNNWGPMHWGHATSEDLYHWKHQPIALFPIKQGNCFSGSAFEDKDNVTGLGSDEDPALLLFYTLHREEDGVVVEEQALAYSTDGITFKNYSENPILINQGTPDFRDPKVFYHEESDQYVMSLAVYDRVEFYTSQNLLDWTFLSAYSSDQPSAQGLWECPDLFSLQFNGEEYWVLIVSYGLPENQGKSVTKYFVGNFDGKEFRSLDDQAYELDFGTDYYAGVSFSNTGQNVLTIGWANNWGYAAESVPASSDFCGQLSGPREHYLYQDQNGTLKVGSKIIDIPEAYEGGQVQLREVNKFSSESLKIHATRTDSEATASLKLSNDKNEELLIVINTDNSLVVDRSRSGDLSFHEMLKDDLYLKRQLAPQSAHLGSLMVLWDYNLIEIYSDDGKQTYTSLVFPSESFNRIECDNLAGTLVFYDAPEHLGCEDLFSNEFLFQ